MKTLNYTPRQVARFIIVALLVMVGAMLVYKASQAKHGLYASSKPIRLKTLTDVNKTYKQKEISGADMKSYKC